MFLELGSPQLKHELLVTLMVEVTGIINSRPIAALSSEVDQPQPLTQNILITMKSRPILPPPWRLICIHVDIGGGRNTSPISFGFVGGESIFNPSRKERNGTNTDQ